MTETDWLDALARLGPAATGVAALVALAVGIATVRQRDRADQRDQWWERARWALETTTAADDETARRGWAVLRHLYDSDLASGDEQGLLRSLGELGLIGAVAPADDGTGVSEEDDDEEEVSGGPDRAAVRGVSATPGAGQTEPAGAAGHRPVRDHGAHAPGPPGPAVDEGRR
jgi:hypothetical protein